MAILEAKGRINTVEKSVRGMTTGFWKLNKVKWEWKEMKRMLNFVLEMENSTLEQKNIETSNLRNFLKRNLSSTDQKGR